MPARAHICHPATHVKTKDVDGLKNPIDAKMRTQSIIMIGRDIN